jgi:hypothetical protein
LSEAQVSLCRRVAAIEIQLEQMEAKMSEGNLSVDMDLYGRLAGHLRRILESIGLKRVARPIDGANELASHFDKPIRQAST